MFVNFVFFCIGTKLTYDDFDVVRNELFKARTKWYEMGLTLKMDNETLRSIEIRHCNDPDKCLEEMIKRCLKGDSLSWEDLCDCLRAPTVRRNDLAEEISKWRQSKLKGA